MTDVPPTSEYKHIVVSRDGGTLVATLVNPPRNLMNATMVQEMHAVVDAIEGDDSVRALIFTGGADGIFITHYDVGELSQISDVIRERQIEGGGTELHALNRLSMRLRGLSQAVIAAINGTAMGGGCELTLACDFRLMARGYQIGLPEARIGILPGAGGTQRMSRMLGQAKALELMLLGNTVDADEAARLGLVHRAVAPERLMPEAMALAAEIAARPATSVREIKRCVYEGIELGMEEALRFEQQAFNRTMRSDDASRLMKAYLQSARPLNEQ